MRRALSQIRHPQNNRREFAILGCLCLAFIGNFAATTYLARFGYTVAMTAFIIGVLAIAGGGIWRATWYRSQLSNEFRSVYRMPLMKPGDTEFIEANGLVVTYHLVQSHYEGNRQIISTYAEFHAPEDFLLFRLARIT
jgi:hypothetical protein